MSTKLLSKAVRLTFRAKTTLLDSSEQSKFSTESLQVVFRWCFQKLFRSSQRRNDPEENEKTYVFFWTLCEINFTCVVKVAFTSVQSNILKENIS